VRTVRIFANKVLRILRARRTAGDLCWPIAACWCRCNCNWCRGRGGRCGLARELDLSCTIVINRPHFQNLNLNAGRAHAIQGDCTLLSGFGLLCPPWLVIRWPPQILVWFLAGAVTESKFDAPICFSICSIDVHHAVDINWLLEIKLNP